MHHGFALLLLIASASILCLALENPDPPTFNHDPHEESSATPNVFAVGTQGDGSHVEGTVAHALGDEGVKKHLKNLQGEAKKQWEADLVLDYSLFNYRKTIAEMTKQCIALMDEMREDMSYETSSVVNKEVDRVWPTLEMGGDMKQVAEVDKENGIRGPCYTDKHTGEKVYESFVLQSRFSKKERWRAYLESQLHKGDHELMGTAVGSTTAGQPRPQVESTSGDGGHVERPEVTSPPRPSQDTRPQTSSPTTDHSHGTQPPSQPSPRTFVEAVPLETTEKTCTQYYEENPPTGKKCGPIKSKEDCEAALTKLQGQQVNHRSYGPFVDETSSGLSSRTPNFCSVKILGSGGSYTWHVKWNGNELDNERPLRGGSNFAQFKVLCGCWDK